MARRKRPREPRPDSEDFHPDGSRCTFMHTELFVVPREGNSATIRIRLPYDPTSPEVQTAIREALAITTMIKRPPPPPPEPPFSYFDFRR
ncbi:MAG TPA: hypothetical protein PKA13_24790 [Geminicoccaceae bacterium]|nr:hypothetical protein [Geminicoccus sp.]HMU53016.1 hypothetical protein [Geminicoccaceae bacterium]